MTEQDAVCSAVAVPQTGSEEERVPAVLTEQDATKDKQKSRLKITHAQNDARYVELGRSLAFAKCAVPPDYEKELANANKNKIGGQFLYPESLIMSLATMRVFTKLSYRVLSGFGLGMLGDGNSPGYRQLQRRIQGIKVSIKDNIVTAHGKNGVLRMAIDGTGASPNNRSEYIKFKHKTKHGFIRIVFIVDTDTREVLGFTVTDDSIGEPQQFEPLVCMALKNLGVTLPEKVGDEDAAEQIEDACKSGCNNTQQYKVVEPESMTAQIEHACKAETVGAHQYKEGCANEQTVQDVKHIETQKLQSSLLPAEQSEPPPLERPPPESEQSEPPPESEQSEPPP